jgi:hypothetical protein
MHTPSTTRDTFPALTEHPANTANDNCRDKQPTKLPTLKYVAIIETDTDQAFFNLNSSDINEKKRKVLENAKEMCTEMASEVYGGKVKLQDIMDMVFKMAKE